MTAASIDIGSNTVLLLLAEIGNGKIRVIRDVQRVPRIAAGLSPGEKMSEPSEARLMTILNEYFSLIEQYRCERIFISATSAFRKASNGPEIKASIERLFGTEVKIVSGDEEAELSFLGTLDYGISGKHRLVIDIGGGSTEIIYGRNTEIDFRKSFDVGVVSLTDKFFNAGKPTNSDLISADNFIREIFSVLPPSGYAPTNTVALAGTPLALQCIKKGISSLDDESIEGSVLLYSEVSEFRGYLSGFSPEELLIKYPDILKGRADLILSGTCILLVIMEILRIDKIIVSAKGVRYGALIKNLILA